MYPRLEIVAINGQYNQNTYVVFRVHLSGREKVDFDTRSAAEEFMEMDKKRRAG